MVFPNNFNDFVSFEFCTIKYKHKWLVDVIFLKFIHFFVLNLQELNYRFNSGKALQGLN